MSEFDFDALDESIWNPLTLARPYAELLDEHDYVSEHEEERILSELYAESVRLGLVGREYRINAGKGLYVLIEATEERDGAVFTPKGTNLFIGRFACHHIFQYEDQADASGLQLYFEDVQAIHGPDTEFIELFGAESRGAYLAPVKKIKDFRPRIN